MRRMTGGRELARGASSLAILLLLVCGVDQPDARVLAKPTASSPLGSTARDAVAQSQEEYVPAPAKPYALRPADVGETWSETPSDEPDGTEYSYTIRMTERDARRRPGPDVLSNRDVSFLVCSVELRPQGSDDVHQQFDDQLEKLRSYPGATVGRKEGWSSEQVFGFRWSEPEGVFVRGIALQHRNAIVLVTARGKEHLTTEERVTGLARIVEARIHAAVQQPAPTVG